MKNVITVFAALALSVPAFAAPKNVTCELNVKATAALPEVRKTDSTDLMSFTMTLNDDGQVDGHYNAFVANEDFTSAKPSEGFKGTTVEPAKFNADGSVTLVIDVPGHDSYTYTIKLSADLKSAKVREDIWIDCMDPTVAFGVYRCYLK